MNNEELRAYRAYRKRIDNPETIADWTDRAAEAIDQLASEIICAGRREGVSTAGDVKRLLDVMQIVNDLGEEWGEYPV